MARSPAAIYNRVSTLVTTPVCTALVSAGCYAAQLADCDGGPVTEEHFISKAIQQALGSQFRLTGMPFAREWKTVGPDIKAKLLCRRHNRALSNSDAAALTFFRAVRDVSEGNSPIVELDGHELERWALKAAVGMLASGEHAIRRDTGEKYQADPHLGLLQVIFGEVEMPADSGFYYLDGRLEGEPAGVGMRLTPLLREPDHPEALQMWGATVGFHGLLFAVTLGPLELRPPERAIYRPRGFVLNDAARIELKWKAGSTGDPLRLRQEERS